MNLIFNYFLYNKIFTQMKKNFKFMLLSLLAMVSTTVFAQRNVNDIFPADNFVYKVTQTMVGEEPGEVTLIGIRDGRNPIVSNVLDIPGYMEADLFGDTYKFNVTALGDGGTYTTPLQQLLNATGTPTGNFANKQDAKTVNFPAQITEIPANCFNGYTNVTAINFAAGSQLETIANGAFSTTQITQFDFSPCTNLAELPNAVFVEAAPATNSYITKITLPESSPLLKHIGTAFQRLSALTKIENLDKSAVTEIVQDAFNGCTSLTEIKLPKTVEYIESGAFAGSGITSLEIDVTAIKYIGIDQPAVSPYTPANYVVANSGNVYGTVAADLAKLTSLTLKGNLGGVVLEDAFKGCGNLATLDLDELNFTSKGQFATSSFENCVKIESVEIGNILDEPGTVGESTIDDDAFKGCTKLTTVTIGDINSANAIGAAAFGNKLKTVTIGTVKAGAASIAAGAFKFDNVKGATLKIATDDDEYLSSDDASTPIFTAGAFDFSAINGSLTGWNNATDAAVVTFGEIRSKGGVFAGGDVKGNYIREIIFDGDIAQGGIDAQIYDNTANGVALNKITFNGKLAQNAIEVNAFANLATNAVTVTFNASLAKEAIMDGAFENMKGAAAAASIILNYTADDNTVNPFQKNAFDNTTPATVASARDIFMTVTDLTLLAQFRSATKGLTTNGAFDVYRVDFYVAPVPADNSFLVYPNQNDKKVAWARINFSSDQLSQTLAGGVNDLKIQRVQTIDGAKVKLTLYATYTDEDDALNASTIYMVPLKVKDGYYHIAKTDNEVIIAKAEKATDFTYTDEVKSHKVAVAVTGYVAGNESLWGGLTNTELKIAANDMTNQQLVDKTAQDAGTPVDIYRGGTTIAEDLYIMNDPSKNSGFRIAKSVIEKKTDGTGAHINAGWYYMLLKHYTGSPAAARVVWMDEDQATGIFGVKTETNKKNFVEDDAIYTLQGVRVSPYTLQKGKIYIQGGKKFIFK